MTFPKVNPGGWATGDKLTHTQITALDADHAISASDAQLAYQIASAAVGNWQAPVTATTLRGGAGNIVAMAWDPTGQRWLAALDVPSSAPFVLYSLNGGRSWSDSFLNGYSGTSLSLAANSGDAWVQCSSATNSTIAYAITSGSGAATTGNPASVATSFWLPTQNVYHSISMYQSGGTFSAGVDTTAAAGVANPVVTVGAVALPAGWVSATNHVGQLLSAVSYDGTTALVALCGVTAGTDTARIMTVTKAGGATVYTDVTPAALTGKIVTGVAYNSVLGLWGVAAYDGGFWYFYTSPDAVAWTGHTGGVGPVGGLASLNSVWAIAVKQVISFDGTPIGAFRILMSGDNGTLWRPTSSPTFATAPLLVASDNQIAVWSSAQLSVSSQASMFAP